MKSSSGLTGWLLLLALVPLCPADDAACLPGAGVALADACQDCCEPPPRLVVRAGTIALRPQNHDPAELVKYLLQPLTASDFAFDFQAGWEIAGIWNASDELGFEVRYFDVGPWKHTFEDLYSGSFIVQSQLQGYSIINFPSPGAVDAEFTSRLKSGEVNARLTSWQPITLLAGFRALALDETIFLDGGFDRALVDVSNQLYGFQVGLEGNWSWNCLSLCGFCKGGAYHATSTVDLRAFDPAVGFSSVGHTTIVGEVGLFANFDLTRRLSFRGGYQVLWIPDMALAPNQFADPVVAGAPIVARTDGDAFFHGFFLGAELRI